MNSQQQNQTGHPQPGNLYNNPQQINEDQQPILIITPSQQYYTTLTVPNSQQNTTFSSQQNDQVFSHLQYNQNPNFQAQGIQQPLLNADYSINIPNQELVMSKNFKTQSDNWYIYLVGKTFLFLVAVMFGVFVCQTTMSSENLQLWMIFSEGFIWFKILYLILSTYNGYSNSGKIAMCVFSGEMRSLTENLIYEEEFNTLKQAQRTKKLDDISSAIKKYLFRRNVTAQIFYYFDKTLNVLFMAAAVYILSTVDSITDNQAFYMIACILLLAFDEFMVLAIICVPLLIALFIVLYIPYKIHMACKGEQQQQQNQENQ